ncbi:aspartate aminotransferase family protein [Sphingoaurantiacus capsulatus]|uniref:Aspartate aminotransferase family protein n=1 Tax=Sphingoaurantiacus capsulatus TaxID=1771310 RepID=A0ABV7XE04_9SPHN
MTLLLHRDLRRPPARALSASGVRIRTSAGREVIDASGGAAVSCLGHAHPAVIEAIRRQAETLAYAHSGFFTTEPAERLAEALVGDVPGGLTRALFVSGGSEAMEAAVKLARQYFLEVGEPQRRRFVARRQSYHGNTLGALALSGNLPRREPYAPLLGTAFSHVSPAFAYRYRAATESDADYVERLRAELVAEFERLGGDTVAAFVAETVGGATSGAVTAPPGYFRMVREVCDRYGALLILDEVMCGLGRTGTRHAWMAEGVAPDLQIVAKGLGGGYQPIGALLVGAGIVDAIEAGSGTLMHGHTYMAHPIACAAALAVQRVIVEQELVGEVQRLGRRLEARLHQRLGQHAHVGDIRGRGLLMAVELVADRETEAPFAPQAGVAASIKAAALDRGLACYPGNGTIDGISGDHVLLAPPFVSSAADIDLIVERLADAIDAVCARAKGQPCG